MLAKTALTAALLALLPSTNALAFPGAVGFGSSATGGTGGSTYVVTNLDDSGDGSFRDAVSESGRIVTFDVSGYIVLESAVSLASDLTINGSTAPSPGIGIMAGEVSASNADNIIIVNMRFRQGSDDPDDGKSAFNMGDASNIILDHCSVAYGQWDSVDAVGAVNITVSNSIIAFPIYQQFGAHVETGPATFFGNLWVSAHNRQPLAKSNTQYINNVVYNYQAAYTTADTSGSFYHDIMYNYFITGPSTTSASDRYYQIESNQYAYAIGNYGDATNDGVLNGAEENQIGDATVLSSPWESTSTSIVKWTAAEAVTNVLASAGASPRDEVDALAVSQVESYGTEGTIYGDQSDTGLSNGGYGTL
ncbi:family 1 polysaccharide lyase [Cryphonectria parasitica EP155]|uniref:Family 1 polysaccharide lyase n=1 Tax=Cryphonectria parasitica (strain ATCC 38755 / EP155) TaxID=660469 RepID=A0A9P5CL33_CRYP1|nr:family 1 polysaccharide lyase [Cryphonectria parasitica EP155]KAF3761807.1 family 1 polysaccharide lyase [Cryphonectria parasitica EP155]